MNDIPRTPKKKMLHKALIMISFWSAFISTIQLQPSHQASWMLMCPLLNVVNICCLAPAYYRITACFKRLSRRVCAGVNADFKVKP